MTQEKQEKLQRAVISLPYRKEKTPLSNVPQSVALSEHSQNAVGEILSRDGQSHATAEDVVSMALEVFNTITKHLSRKDSRVILHTGGESPKTLALNRTAGSHREGVRTVYRSVADPRVKR